MIQKDVSLKISTEIQCRTTHIYSLLIPMHCNQRNIAYTKKYYEKSTGKASGWWAVINLYAIYITRNVLSFSELDIWLWHVLGCTDSRLCWSYYYRPHIGNHELRPVG